MLQNSDKRRRIHSELGALEPVKKITVGICAMDKKVKSKAMQEILSLFNENFQIVYFGNEMLLESPIELWPQVDCLIAFYSTGFPLEKAIRYAQKTSPYLVNDLAMQRTLFDRRKVYDVLKEIDIPTPRHIVVDRDNIGQPGYQEPEIEEHDEFAIFNGEKIYKPFVEKPVDAEDHNIHIYYPSRLGGGSKRLFRKVGDRSSEFYPDENKVRRDGSYIYEEFISTQGTDVKVYTVGPEYGHCEARKSPTVDGKVNRDKNGKEIRFPVILSDEEKLMAAKISHAFKQYVCGFDILRFQKCSYVCDVNGWSFVKGNYKYYDDCSQLLQEWMQAAVYPKEFLPAASAVGPMLRSYIPDCPKPLRSYRNILSSEPNMSQLKPKLVMSGNTPSTSPKTSPFRNSKSLESFEQFEQLIDVNGLAHQRGSKVWKFEQVEDLGEPQSEQKDNLVTPSSTPDFSMKKQPSYNISADEKKCPDPSETEELRCVIAVARHGDRTPKQKLKITVEYEEYLNFFRKYTDDPRAELKIKKKEKMFEFLEITKRIIDKLQEAGEGAKEELDKFENVRDVLERWKFSGINRKVQLKPKKWGVFVTGDILEGNSEHAIQLQMVVKWGGELTSAGEQQAERVGRDFRTFMYPDPGGGGLLRLHSTFRHDLKIRTSNEGRVMKTAAAFTKGLLELEGDLTPILVSLVLKEYKSEMMLDRSGNQEVKSEMDRCKRILNEEMQIDQEIQDHIIDTSSVKSKSVKQGIKEIRNPYQALCRLKTLIGSLVAQLLEIKRKAKLAGEKVELYQGETLSLMIDRWRKLEREMYSTKNNRFDLSKVPDVLDNIRYDALHNAHLRLEHTEELYHRSATFASVIVPQEFGLDPQDKRLIGSKTCKSLLQKIHSDLVIARSQDDGKDVRFKFDERYAKEHEINSIGRRVRSRLYFTSESHLHTLINCLRYPPTGCKSLLKRGARRLLGQIKELSYLTMVVFRLYEDPCKPLNDPSRFRVEILFTPGVTAPPDFQYRAEEPGASYPSAFEVEQVKVLRDRLHSDQVENYFDKICNQVYHAESHLHFIRSPMTSPSEQDGRDSPQRLELTQSDLDRARRTLDLSSPQDSASPEVGRNSGLDLAGNSVSCLQNIIEYFPRALKLNGFSNEMKEKNNSKKTRLHCSVKAASVVIFGCGLVTLGRFAYRRHFGAPS